MSDDVERDLDVDREVEPGLSDQYRKASPWPMFVALGFVLSEVGVVLGLFPVTVGGLVLFGGTVAAILRESGYVDQPWRSLLALGGVLVGLGALALLAWADSLSVSALLNPNNPVAYRGFAIVVSGVMLGALGGTLWAVDGDIL